MEPNTVGRGTGTRGSATGKPPLVDLKDLDVRDLDLRDPVSPSPGPAPPASRARMAEVLGDNALPAGTIVFAQDGALPVEYLAAGDRVISRDAGMVTLSSVRARRATVPAVSVSAGSLGHGKPKRDCLLPAAQALLVRDWRAEVLANAPQAMIPARRLIDGEFIRDAGERLLTLYELECPDPHVIYAEGLEVASTEARALT